MESKTCTKCGHTKPATSEFFRPAARGKFGLRAECKPCQIARGKRWNRANRERINARALERYYANREDYLAQVRRWRAANKERNAENARRWNQKQRIEVLLAYGGKCARCGHAIPEELELHHVGGDGSAHRSKVGNHASAVYVDLKRRGWPDDIELLCVGCHMIADGYLWRARKLLQSIESTQ